MYLTSQVSKTQSRGRGAFLHPSQDPLQGETFTALQGVSVSTGMQQWKVWLKTQPQHFFVLVTISFFLKVFNLDWKFHTWSKPSSNFLFLTGNLWAIFKSWQGKTYIYFFEFKNLSSTLWLTAAGKWLILKKLVFSGVRSELKKIHLHTKRIGSCAITHLIDKYTVVVIFQEQVIRQ